MVAAVAFPPLEAILLTVGIFILWFFRDLERSLPDESGVAVPADGRASVIRIEDGRVRVGVFMNVTGVHVNRTPVSGSVRTVTHRPGAHKPTFSKDSGHSERVDIELDADTNDHEVSLIAGVFA